MIQRSVMFIQPGRVQIQQKQLDPPGRGQVLVRTMISAISTGTERLIFQGQAPADLALDEGISALQGSFHYPFVYGYCLIGEVVELGAGVEQGWLGKQVFSFHPHENLFIAAPDQLQPLPDGMSPERAVFFPNMETAVNFIQDGRPMLGEKVALYGLGIVGLLTGSLLLRFPVDAVGFDLNPSRCAAAKNMGLTVKNSSADGCDSGGMDEFDLGYELSGSPAALDALIQKVRFSGRVVIGSWYGTKSAVLSLGGRFHRNRIELVSSQVSSIHPALSGRWDKQRRYQLVWEMLEQVQPEKWITHRFPLSEAQSAYAMIANPPEDFIQSIFTYDD